ncbi:AfsR/SARP family transcriptional regulator [Actinophytocola glycyrrhizae]|uniref:BTAD domain-containing putative transcriptional regulator n=1 Tax=Actinophytocola glycyrrhizae TaxID=2044873 RepID=A0ABV9RVN7_9PSEU
MEFRVLGPVAVRLGEQVQVVTGRLQRTLLGVLLSRVNQPVPVDALTDALWGGNPDPRAAQKLQLHVHRVRALLDDPDRLSFGNSGYRLRAAPEEIDAERFRVLADEAANLEPHRAVKALRAALGLWQGVPFAGVDVPALNDWARQLTERRLTACEALYQAELACGLHEAVIDELTELTAEHPLRERLHGLLMTALYRAGRQSDALAVYRRARDIMVAELGLEPGPELRELHQRVLGGDLREPVAAVHGDLPAQLPADVRGFTGRDAELSELDGMLATEPPMVIAAVAGTPGVGKTALAVHWAHRVRDRFPDGQLYVDLRGYGPDEPLSAADALAGFLRALGLDGAAIPDDLAERAARFRSLVDQRRLLVLLDNARSVDQVRPLLPGSATGFTLVTSRDSLAGLVAREGAHRIGLNRLPIADAVRLLHGLLGARAEAEPAAVGTLVERCARLPLTLRIAAELVRSRPGRAIGELAGELASQQDTLDLLDIDGDPYTAVRAVFSWSYRRLDPAAARVFRLLGVHPGHDVDVTAVAAMTGTGRQETRRALAALVRAHLVDQAPGGRYRPHDLLRVYAAELAEADDTAAPLTRLLDHYLATACAAMDVIAPHERARRPVVTAAATRTFDDYQAAFGWLDTERANLFAATLHAAPAYVVGMSDALWRYLHLGGYDDDALTLHTRALVAAESLGDAAMEANARRTLANATFRAGHVPPALAHLQRARELYQQVGDRSLEAAAWNNIGIMHWRQGDLAKAIGCFRHTERLYTEIGGTGLRAPAMNNLARLLCMLGQYDEAYEQFERGLENARASGNRASVTSALCGLARVHLATANHSEALGRATTALTTAQDTGYRVLAGTATRLIGAAHRGLGEHETAVRHLDAAIRIARMVGEPDDLMAALNERAAAHVDAGEWDAALGLHREVLATEDGNRDELAHALAGIGDVHAALGDDDAARERWRRAAAIYREMGMPQADDMAVRLLTTRPRPARSV